MKVVNYLKDDIKKDDFHFKRNALIFLLVISPMAAINELYKGHMKVIKLKAMSVNCWFKDPEAIWRGEFNNYFLYISASWIMAPIALYCRSYKIASFIASAFYAYCLGILEINKQDYYFSASYGLLGKPFPKTLILIFH